MIPLTQEEKFRKLLHETQSLTRVQLIKHLKRYRGWELANFIEATGQPRPKNPNKTTALQIILSYLLNYHAGNKPDSRQ